MKKSIIFYNTPIQLKKRCKRMKMKEQPGTIDDDEKRMWKKNSIHDENLLEFFWRSRREQTKILKKMCCETTKSF